MSFHIGHRELGDGHPCFITYEAGPTHGGLESALALARLAAEAGADAVKFQILDPDRLVADKKQLFTYSILVDKKTGKTEERSEPLYDILCRRSLTRDEWRLIKKECDDLGLAFFATISFAEEIDFLVSLGCQSIKIASGDVSHTPLLRKAAATGLCLQIDTGNSTLGEIENAVDAMLAEGNQNIIIHHCPSGYPARRDGINLRILTTLKQMFPFPIAFSDHSAGWVMDVAALSLGANLLEKTITFDRATPSVEHVFSLEPPEMREFVQTVRDVETAMGTARRAMSAEERKKSLGVRRSCFFGQDAGAGATVTEDILEYRRPGTGIPPSQSGELLGRKLVRPARKGKPVLWRDVE